MAIQSWSEMWGGWVRFAGEISILAIAALWFSIPASPCALGILRRMNEEAWIAALQSLRDEQQRLLTEMRRIDQRIGELAALRSTASSSMTAAAAPAPVLLPSPAPVVISTPPPLPPAPAPAVPAPSLPPPLPLKLAPAAPVATQAPSEPPPLRTPSPAPAPKPAESLEMRVGSYWLVRIGVAILLTGLVFLATYLYQTITPRLGPAGKTGLLYLASGALLGLGAWLSRRAKEPRMQNFASVVEAGGLAAVFFTTYAAHYLPGLQIISSPGGRSRAAARVVGLHHLAYRAGGNPRRSRPGRLR